VYKCREGSTKVFVQENGAKRSAVNGNSYVLALARRWSLIDLVAG
jgi:hypothetical protein